MKIYNISKSMQNQGLKITQSVKQVNLVETTIVLLPLNCLELTQLTLCVTKYPKCLDFRSKRGGV